MKSCLFSKLSDKEKNEAYSGKGTLHVWDAFPVFVAFLKIKKYPMEEVEKDKYNEYSYFKVPGYKIGECAGKIVAMSLRLEMNNKMILLD